MLVQRSVVFIIVHHHVVGKIILAATAEGENGTKKSELIIKLFCGPCVHLSGANDLFLTFVHCLLLFVVEMCFRYDQQDPILH